jgi:hypothetical protein
MTLVKVEDLKDGDRVDLLSCPYLHNIPLANYEYAVVDGVVKETSDCIRVMYFDLDWVGYPVGTLLEVRDNQKKGEE